MLGTRKTGIETGIGAPLEGVANFDVDVVAGVVAVVFGHDGG